jgi:hypothetical protein
MNLKCVYFLPIDIKKDNNKIKYSSKLIEKNLFSINETKVISKLTKYTKHFLMPICIEKINSAIMYDNINYLQALKNIRDDNYFMFKYENRNLVYFKYYLKALNSSRKYIYSLIHFYKYLLSTIQILIEHNIIHNNIEIDNIIIDEFDDPLLVSFEFAIDNNFAENLKYYYDTNNLIRCSEFHIVSYMLTNKLEILTLNDVEIIINSIIDTNNLIHNFGETFVNNFKEDGIKYFRKYVTNKYEYIIEDILQYSHTWDNYSLSMLFLKICIDIHRKIKEPNNFIINFMKLLVHNISINPSKRKTIQETLNEFHKILNEKDLSCLIDEL